MATVEYNVVINASGLGAAVGDTNGADGFIDPRSVDQIRSNDMLVASSFTAPTLNSVVYISNYPVTLSSGTSLSSVITDINNSTRFHGVVASNSSGVLALMSAPLFANKVISVSDGVDGSAGTAAKIFPSPQTIKHALPTTKNQSLAKERGNMRWKMILETLCKTASLQNIYECSLTTSAFDSYDSNPSVISFNVVYDSSDFYLYDNAGNQRTGDAAIKYAIADVLMTRKYFLKTVFDPTIVTISPPPSIVEGPITEKVLVGSLTTNQTTALNAVTVSLVTGKSTVISF